MITPLLATLLLSPTPVDSLAWRRVEYQGLDVRYTTIDSATVHRLLPVLAQGRANAVEFFGAPFAMPFVIRIFPDRASLTDHWARAWHAPDLQTQCWMVASGVAEEMTVLSPRAWATDACEHSAADSEHTARLLAHELVHVYHGQRSPSPNFDGMDDIGWFAEGLATYASGQLQAEHLGAAAQALAEEGGPARLEDGWSGRYRYGISGSLVEFLDRTWGRATTRRLLGATTEGEILTALGITEDALLDRWRADVARTRR